MADAYIALDGTAPMAAFRMALRHLRTRYGELQVSPVYTQATPSTGAPTDTATSSLHLVARCNTLLPLGELQQELNDIAAHSGVAAPDNLTLTLLMLSTSVLRDGRYELPHPLLPHRREWLQALQALAPDLQHPSLGQRFLELAQSAGRGNLKQYDHTIA